MASAGETRRAIQPWKLLFKFHSCWNLEKTENFTKILQKWPPAENVKPNRNLIYVITWCSYSAEMKLRYTNFTSVVALLHLKTISFTKTISKQVNVTKKLGQFGTVIPLAPVLCFKPAVNRQPGFCRWDS